MRTDMAPRLGWAGPALAALVALAAPGGGATAQLRPLEPLEWSVFEPGRSMVASVGGAVFPRLNLSLSGSRGRLVELGNFGLTLRFDRIALEASGTLRRRFDREVQTGAPYAGTRPSTGEPRSDVGEFTIGTAVRLTDEDAPIRAVVRFGSRLPTTDNTIGLGRDQTDFYALLGGSLRRGRIAAAAEAGVGLNGTRDPEFEQADVLLYAVQLHYRAGTITPTLALVGQQNGLDGWRLRGTEDLSEARIGLQVGRDRWLRVLYVHGMTEFSPESGVMVEVGLGR